MVQKHKPACVALQQGDIVQDEVLGVHAFHCIGAWLAYKPPYGSDVSVRFIQNLNMQPAEEGLQINGSFGQLWSHGLLLSFQSNRVRTNARSDDWRSGLARAFRVLAWQ